MRRRPAAALALVLLLAACGGGDDSGSASTSSTGAAGTLEASAASYDLAVGPPTRFIVGVFDRSKGGLAYGSVQLRFSFLGEKRAEAEPQPGPTATATFLPIPGSPPVSGPVAKPSFVPVSHARGVYSAMVGFDRPGFWEVEVTADIEGAGTRKATSAFQVLPSHNVPAPGDPALPSENLTASTTGAPPEAIDSRASGGRPVPDAELHQTTVAKALAAKEPVLLVISTPTFCVSMFCGPVTDMISALAARYPDRARFVHIEVWKNFQKQELNQAAAEWISRGGGRGATEPWVFLIGADGRITARWDNVASESEIEPLLRALPAGAVRG
jgi:hypothetical protein